MTYYCNNGEAEITEVENDDDDETLDLDDALFINDEIEFDETLEEYVDDEQANKQNLSDSESNDQLDNRGSNNNEY